MNRNTLSTDDLAEMDRKFSTFFKAQLPQQWPQAPVAMSEVAHHRPASQFDKGRVTLAASVACLLGLGLALSYGPTFQGNVVPNGGLLQNSNADGSKFNKHMNPENQPKLPTP